MRFLTGLCLSASLLAVPVFAQGAFAQTTTAPAASLDDSNSSADNTARFAMGLLDNLQVVHGSERPTMSLAPIEKDQLVLSIRPGGKWGLTLDLTSRGPNDVLPREEFKAGAYYQVTPRFRFGGGVTLNGNDLSRGENWKSPENEAGVRIESAFSF
ncbi:MAG: hypothetical protein R3C52_15735 [Hyphomonadaceae bacterium]